MKIIAGLGNPGSKYSDTRHNTGFMLVDRMIERFGPASKKDFGSSNLFTVDKIRDLFLVKPMRYMNRSGEDLFSIIRYYKISLEDLLIAYDDIDLPFGIVRYRMRGGDGGHNGVRSVIDCLKSSDFKRVRIGVGRPSNAKIAVRSYLLSDFSADEKDEIKVSLDLAIDIAVKELSIELSI